MRIYRVTLHRPGTCPKKHPLYFLGEVEDHQRSDDAMHAAIMAHPDLIAHHCKLIGRGKQCDKWPGLVQGMLH